MEYVIHCMAFCVESGFRCNGDHDVLHYFPPKMQWQTAVLSLLLLFTDGVLFANSHRSAEFQIEWK